MSTRKPTALKKGDTIGIAASSSPFDKDAFKQGTDLLASLGFKVYFRDDIFDKNTYLAGYDERRADELRELFNQESIGAILFARGGYGMTRVLPFLQKNNFKPKPKIILGYSDITPLLTYLLQDHGLNSFYGPVVAKDLNMTMNALTREHLYHALTCTTPLGSLQFRDAKCIRRGECEGVFVGGCLSLITATLGTNYELDTKNKILFLEDTNEKPYAIDRMLTQLVQAGKLKGVKGILFGTFYPGNDSEHYRQTISDVLKDFSGPILFNFPAGHGPVKITLPLGIKARLTSHEQKLEFLEPALSDS